TMTLAAEREYAHMGETSGAADHDYDLIKELGRRLDAMWRYDQHLANAQGRESLVSFWLDLKAQEAENIKRLKELIAEEVQSGCF
ncbi:MAG: hypothetical protein ACYS0D_14140, partial [Planctomycetota bacterium]